MFAKNYLDVDSESYRGVEPSKKLVNLFRLNNPKLSRTIVTKSFEESFDRWEKYGDEYILLALFGSASYIMKPYIEKVSNSGNKFFLMFYKEWYVPEPFKDMHHFNYSSQYLANIFKNAHIIQTNYYYIICSEEINLSKALAKHEQEYSRGLFD
jgi:hypothetical protein